jgi:very-short-patch-repair endonuclease
VRTETSPPTPFRAGEGGASVPPVPPLSRGRGEGGEAFSRGPGMTGRARGLRKAMTEAEKRLWARLRGDVLGVRFRRQLVIDQRYIVDFCAPAISLIVEVDGGQHAASAADSQRDRALEALGYRILRFWNNEGLEETDAVAGAILAEVAARSSARASPLSPLRDGEGKRPTFPVVPRLVRTTSEPKART